MRLIDADAFVAEMKDRVDAAIQWGVNAIADRNEETRIKAEEAVAAFCEASLTAKKMPTVDAVPVIRCKDCKHWHCDDSESYCDELGIFDTDMNSYCSYAKRREE